MQTFVKVQVDIRRGVDNLHHLCINAQSLCQKHDFWGTGASRVKIQSLVGDRGCPECIRRLNDG